MSVSGMSINASGSWTGSVWSGIKSGYSWTADKTSYVWDKTSPYLSRFGQLVLNPLGLTIISAVYLVGICSYFHEGVHNTNKVTGLVGIGLVALTVSVVAGVFIGFTTPIL